MISRRNVIKLFAICALLTLATNFPSGFTNSSINTAVEELRRFLRESYEARGWSLSKMEESLLRSATLNCWFVSQIFGAIFAPFLTDRYGRKVAYIVATVVMTLSAALQYLSVVWYIPEIFILGRSICAFCSPISDAALIMYLQECSPMELRGAFSFMCETGYGLMCLLGMLLGMRTVLGDSLKHLTAVSIVPQIFYSFFLLFIPETPKYLMITKNDRARALKSLEFFQGRKKENETLLDEYAKEAEGENDCKTSSINEILTTWHLRQAVILAIFVLVLSLPFYPVLQSSTFFFTKANIPSHIAEFSSMILMLLLTVASIIGTTFVDRFPRRRLLFVFGTSSTLFLTLFSVTAALCNKIWWMKYASVVSMGVYITIYAMVVGPMTWFMGPELVTQKHRATVFCFCFAVCNVLIAVTNFASIPLYEYVGPLTFIPLFVIPSGIALIYLFFYLPETRNRETHRIVESMRRKSQKDLVSYAFETSRVLKF